MPILQNCKNNRENGFTLIELSIVVVIAAILIFVALPRFLDVEERAEIAVLKNGLASIRSAARIAESYAVASGHSGNGYLEVNGEVILFLNGYPVSRAHDISETGPGNFSGIVHLMELEGRLNLHYSELTAVQGRTEVADDYLILSIADKCIKYRPPQIKGHLPEYSDDIEQFDNITKTCNFK